MSTRHFSSELALGLYNAYGRENAYAITFRQDPNDPTETQAVQTALFPVRAFYYVQL